MEEFYTLKDSFESKSEDKWFYKNLKEKDPELYSDPEVVLNIFPQNTEPHVETNTNSLKTGLSSSDLSIVFLFCQTLMSIIELLISKTIGLAVLISICILILFFMVFYYYNEIISDRYDVAITRKDYMCLVKEYFYADLLYLVSFMFIFFA